MVLWFSVVVKMQGIKFRNVLIFVVFVVAEFYKEERKFMHWGLVFCTLMFNFVKMVTNLQEIARKIFHSPPSFFVYLLLLNSSLLTFLLASLSLLVRKQRSMFKSVRGRPTYVHFLQFFVFGLFNSLTWQKSNEQRNRSGL